MTNLRYVACPYCANTLLLNRFLKTKFPIDPLDFFLVSDRQQKSDFGRKKGDAAGKVGFFRIPGSERTIVQLAHGNLEERQIAQKIVSRIKQIHDSYDKAGLL